MCGRCGLKLENDAGGDAIAAEKTRKVRLEVWMRFKNKRRCCYDLRHS